MGKPVHPGVVGHSYGCAAVHGNAPQIDCAVTFAVEPNPMAIGSVIRSVAMIEILGQLFFFAAGDGSGIDLKTIFPLGGIGDAAAVRGPPMPIGWPIWRQKSGRAALGGQEIYPTFAGFAAVLNDDLAAVRGNAVIVVQLVEIAGIDVFQGRVRQIHAEKLAIAVDDLV